MERCWLINKEAVDLIIKAEWEEIAELIKGDRGVTGDVEQIFIKDGQINVQISDPPDGK